MIERSDRRPGRAAPGHTATDPVPDAAPRIRSTGGRRTVALHPRHHRGGRRLSIFRGSGWRSPGCHEKRRRTGERTDR
ncbi:Uncharacterised protein [Amycolatopsis camponoti]|uniref:Uncharacterized protein n=1 Tax=Amycolatopsis camponoti TaxID=2606593 RepID=A0A6I8LXR7_9PSEU|nr:Uncharacterised protein [Amycolatopsis camponoti]